MSKMNLTKWGVIAVALLTYLMPSDVKAQDKVEVSLGADLVSGYVWRGQDLGGVSLSLVFLSQKEVYLLPDGDLLVLKKQTHVNLTLL